MNTPSSPDSVYKQQIVAPPDHSPTKVSDIHSSRNMKKHLHLYHPYSHYRTSPSPRDNAFYPPSPKSAPIQQFDSELRPLDVPLGYKVMLVPEINHDPSMRLEAASQIVSPSQCSMYPTMYKVPVMRQRSALGIYETKGRSCSPNGTKKGPQRPPNAFILYRSNKHRELLRENPKQSACTISQMISRMWANEDPEIKSHYQALAAERKAEFEANRHFSYPSQSLFRIDTSRQALYGPSGNYNSNTIASATASFPPFNQYQNVASNSSSGGCSPTEHLPPPAQTRVSGQQHSFALSLSEPASNNVSACLQAGVVTHSPTFTSVPRSLDDLSAAPVQSNSAPGSQVHTPLQPHPSILPTSNSTIASTTSLDHQKQLNINTTTTANSSPAQSWQDAYSNTGFLPLFTNMVSPTVSGNFTNSFPLQ